MTSTSHLARRPPLLAPGARVALVSPAGPLRGEQDVERAVANARAFGWEPAVGFSDVTALHFAIRQRCGIISYHGPTARAELTPFSRDSLERAVVRGEDSCGVAAAARVLRSGRVRGPLVGGNLALVTALLGTPVAPDFDGAVLVLEDVNEPVYRIDRMLQQLRLAGVLARVGALVLGAFTERGDE